MIDPNLHMGNGPEYAPPPPAAARNDESGRASNDQKDHTRNKVLKVVAGIFIALAALAIVGCVFVGAVVAPIAFVGVLIALPVLVVASVATAAARGANVGRLRFHRPHRQPVVVVDRHEYHTPPPPPARYVAPVPTPVVYPTAYAGAAVLPTGQQVPGTRNQRGAVSMPGMGAQFAPAPARTAHDTAVLPTGQQVPGTRARR